MNLVTIGNFIPENTFFYQISNTKKTDSAITYQINSVRRLSNQIFLQKITFL